MAGGLNVRNREIEYDDRIRKFLLGHLARVSNVFWKDDRFVFIIKSESKISPSHNLYLLTR